MSKILDAVSIVLVHGEEIFPIQRQNFLRAFPGYWAFPGGKVDEIDHQSVATHSIVKAIPTHLWAAIQREAQEELGVDFNLLLVQNSITRVLPIGVALTPDFNPYRFRTHFYSIHLNSKPQLHVDANEAARAEWMKPSEFVNRFEKGELLVVPPVLKVAKLLSTDLNSTDQNIDLSYDTDREVPMIESIKGIKQFMPLSNTLPPAYRTNAFVIGDLLIDPSPKDERELEKFLYSLREESLKAIMLTHHHGDHHQFAPEIARRFNLPILLSVDTQMRLKKLNPDYFEGVKLSYLKENDIPTSWLGMKVKVVEVPGHDRGQLALMPENRLWFIAGDLFQGVGTVVIGGDEGDMQDYMRTLEKVIKLNPRVVFPSHGIGLGGVTILERTLTHRKMREDQIIELMKARKSEDEILGVLYSDIDERLLKYASENIRSHISKIKKECLI